MVVLPPTAFDKLYWLRVGFAAIGGLLADVLIGTDYASGVSLGIAMYLASYYIARYTWYRGTGKETQAKVYSTGWGGFLLVFVFTWMLVFTLQVVGSSA